MRTHSPRPCDTRAAMAMALTATLAMASALTGCEQQHRDNWGRLQEGMTKEQVEYLLGEPSSRIDAKREGIEIIVPFDRWQYGDNLSTLATAAVFPAEAPDRVWAVYFDEEGRVIDFRPPIRAW